mgnify:FL=1
MGFIKLVLFIIGIVIAIAIAITLLIVLKLLVECLLEWVGVPSIGHSFRIEDILRIMGK